MRGGRIGTGIGGMFLTGSSVKTENGDIVAAVVNHGWRKLLEISLYLLLDFLAYDYCDRLPRFCGI